MPNKNFLIVGGTSGIGLSLVEEMQGEEANIYVMARNKPEKMVESSDFIAHDVLDNDWPAERLPDELSGLAYLPGTITLKPFERTSVETFKKDWSINVEGAVRVLQESADALKDSSGPSNVVLFSTVASQVGMKYHASIASAKSALEGLTKSVAAEWAPDVRLNLIAPSLTETPMAESLLSSDRKRDQSVEKHPLKQIASPDQIASMANQLLTGDNHMTGEVIRMDGGISNLDND